MLILKLLGWVLIIDAAYTLSVMIYFAIRAALEISPKHKCKFCSDARKSFCREHERYKEECKGAKIIDGEE